MNGHFNRIISVIMSFCLLFEHSGFAQIAAQADLSGFISASGSVLSSEFCSPARIRFISYDPGKDKIDFLVDKGGVSFREEADSPDKIRGLLNYFLVGLALPDTAFWVNLRPGDEDNIIDPDLATTDVGRVMLEADVCLKKDTARYTSPYTPEGRVYWQKLYDKAEELYGKKDLSIPSIARPWIIPDEIIIRQTEESVYIYKATLKVMLEEDYLLRLSGPAGDMTADLSARLDPRAKKLNEYAAGLMRELIIPKLNREINSSKRYAPLRQVYYSLILAQWFKRHFKADKGGYASLIDRKKLTGLVSEVPWSKLTYFKEYERSFREGEYNVSIPVKEIPGGSVRTYVSGGLALQRVLATADLVKGDPRNTALLPGIQGLDHFEAGDEGKDIKRILGNGAGEEEIVPSQGEKYLNPGLSPFRRFVLGVTLFLSSFLPLSGFSLPDPGVSLPLQEAELAQRFSENIPIETLRVYKRISDDFPGIPVELWVGLEFSETRGWAFLSPDKSLLKSEKGALGPLQVMPQEVQRLNDFISQLKAQMSENSGKLASSRDRRKYEIFEYFGFAESGIDLDKVDPENISYDQEYSRMAAACQVVLNYDFIKDFKLVRNLNSPGWHFTPRLENEEFGYDMILLLVAAHNTSLQDVMNALRKYGPEYASGKGADWKKGLSQESREHQDVFLGFSEVISVTQTGDSLRQRIALAEKSVSQEQEEEADFLAMSDSAGSSTSLSANEPGGWSWIGALELFGLLDIMRRLAAKALRDEYAFQMSRRELERRKASRRAKLMGKEVFVELERESGGMFLQVCDVRDDDGVLEKVPLSGVDRDVFNWQRVSDRLKKLSPECSGLVDFLCVKAEQLSPEIYVFHPLVRDLFGAAFSKEDVIAFYYDMLNEPIAVFHEAGEYLIGKKDMFLSVERSNIQVRDSSGWLVFSLPLSRDDARSLLVRAKGQERQHYLLRALQRQLFGEYDIRLTQVIKAQQRFDRLFLKGSFVDPGFVESWRSDSGFKVVFDLEGTLTDRQGDKLVLKGGALEFLARIRNIPDTRVLLWTETTRSKVMGLIMDNPGLEKIFDVIMTRENYPGQKDEQNLMKYLPDIDWLSGEELMLKDTRLLGDNAVLIDNEKRHYDNARRWGFSAVWMRIFDAERLLERIKAIRASRRCLQEVISPGANDYQPTALRAEFAGMTVSGLSSGKKCPDMYFGPGQMGFVRDGKLSIYDGKYMDVVITDELRDAQGKPLKARGALVKGKDGVLRVLVADKGINDGFDNRETQILRVLMGGYICALLSAGVLPDILPRLLRMNDIYISDSWLKDLAVLPAQDAKEKLDGVFSDDCGVVLAAFDDSIAGVSGTEVGFNSDIWRGIFVRLGDNAGLELSEREKEVFLLALLERKRQADLLDVISKLREKDPSFSDLRNMAANWAVPEHKMKERLERMISFEEYLRQEGLFEYRNLRNLFDDLVIDALIADRTLRPLFLHVLNPKYYDNFTVVDDGTLGLIGGRELLMDYAAFLASKNLKIIDQMAKEGRNIVVGVGDKPIAYRMHKYYFPGELLANGRQASFPLSDGTWLNVKGSGNFDDAAKEVYNAQASRGLVYEWEVDWAAKYYPEIKRDDLSGGLYFPQFLGYCRVHRLPDGYSFWDNADELQDEDGDVISPVLVFSRVIHPHRLVKLPQILRDDPGLVKLTARIADTLRGINYPGKIPENAHELMLLVADNMGAGEAVKVNHGLGKVTLHPKDFNFIGQESDLEELRRFSELKGISEKEFSGIMTKFNVMLGMLLFAFRTGNSDALFPSFMENCEVMFGRFFGDLDTSHIEEWNGSFVPDIKGILNDVKISRMFADLAALRGDMVISAESILELILRLAREELEKRKGAGGAESGEAGVASSLPQKEEADTDKGGIDFMKMPMVVKSGITEKALQCYSKSGETIDEHEWRELKNMVNSGVIPSETRVSGYVFSLRSRGELDENAGDILPCLAGMLRLQEEQDIATSSVMKEVLEGI